MPSVLSDTIALPHANGSRLRESILASRLVHEMADAWRQGSRPVVEEVLSSHPEVEQQTDLVMRLICEEMCLRSEFGQPMDTAELQFRFPRWRDQLQVLLECHRLVGVEPAESGWMATVRRVLADYQILTPLGRGAQGQVFLATQTSLGDRPVVLKVSVSAGFEHLSLARLQHTHIMPLYAMEDFPERNLRVLCMPYLGCATLDQVVRGIQDGKAPWGQRLLDALDVQRSGLPIEPLARGSARGRLARSNRVEAACWITCCIADALQYAHERGLVHLDVKPSNILLAADGQPLLLDFHLARSPLHAGDKNPGWFGGTPAFMSPEQELACDAITAGKPIPADVDGRSDIYSLGLVLLETLGRDPEEAGRPIRPWSPEISVGLADILNRCLAAKQEDRYATAGELADDLRRHLSHQLLKGVANRCWKERWRKWRRRRPFALAALAGAAMLLIALVLAGNLAVVHHQDRGLTAENALRSGQDQIQSGSYAEAARTLENGMDQLAGSWGHADLSAALANHLALARRHQAAAELHQGAELCRLLSLGEPAPPRVMNLAHLAFQTSWRDRQALAAPKPRLPQPIEMRIRQDLLDLAVQGADLGMRLAGSSESARREALVILDQAEALLGPSPVLDRERRLHAEALGEPAELAPRQPDRGPASPWEQAALARSFLRAGQLDEARRLLESAAASEPGSFWINYYLGHCARRLGQQPRAVAAFSVCIGSAPENPAPYVERARAHAALGEVGLAFQDLAAAVALDGSGSALDLREPVERLVRQRLLPRALAPLSHELAAAANPHTGAYQRVLQLLSQPGPAARSPAANQGEMP